MSSALSLINLRSGVGTCAGTRIVEFTNLIQLGNFQRSPRETHSRQLCLASCPRLRNSLVEQEFLDRVSVWNLNQALAVHEQRIDLRSLGVRFRRGHLTEPKRIQVTAIAIKNTKTAAALVNSGHWRSLQWHRKAVTERDARPSNYPSLALPETGLEPAPEMNRTSPSGWPVVHRVALA